MKQTAVEIYNEFMNKDYLGVRVTTEDRIIHAMEAYKLQSEEEAIEFAKWCAELKVYDNETYVNNTLETLFEQFKNK